jgi:peroxin-2
LFGNQSEDDTDFKKGGELGFLPERTCAICYFDQNPIVGVGGEAEIAAATSGGGGVIGSAATDITNPYEAIPCGCVYCFVCLAQRIEAEEGEGWTCLRCGETILECKPWNGDVLEEPLKLGGNGKSVGFSQDTLQVHEPLVTPSLTDVTMRELEPMPTEDELETVDDEEPEPTMAADINESSEWARASETMEESDDETTETGSYYNSDDEEDDDRSHRGISIEH